MFDALIALALRHRALILIGAALVGLWGLDVARKLPVDVFPDLNRPTVAVMTEAGGLAPEEVELLVSRPIEVAMGGTPGVERVRSQSGAGLSVVWVEFGWETELFRARQQVGERLDQVREALPDGVSAQLGPVSSIMGEILLIGLSSPDGKVDGPALRHYAETDLRPRILGVKGVAQVIALGGGLAQLDVEVEPLALAARQISLEEVRQAAASAQDNTTGGFLSRKSQEYLVRNLSRTSDPEVLAQTVVAQRDGVPVLLGDVATVRRGVVPPRGEAGVNGHPGVILSVQKQPGVGTLEVTDAVLNAVGAPPEGVVVTPLFRQADFVAASVANVEVALRDGAVLVAIVMVVFLMSWRTTVISLTAIPLSFLTAFATLHALGMSINTMTLGGLAVACGELVDDAIVDVENVWRRLRENALLDAPRPTLEVIAAASSEVRSAIVFSTVLVILVFAPIAALTGIEGRLFWPLAVAYVTAILASMFVSLTVTPALCSLLLPSSGLDRGASDGWVVRNLQAADRRLLGLALRWPRAVMGGAAAAVVAAVLTVPFLGTSFLPAFSEGTATVNLQARPGTSLEESGKLGQLAERLLLSIPEVASVGRRTGRAELDEHAEGVHYTEIDVDFRDGRPREEVLVDVRDKLAQIGGVSVNVGQPISHRLDHLLSGVRSSLVLKLYGDDLGVLRSEAAALAAKLREIEGLVDVAVEPQVLVPQVHVRVDRPKAARFGIPPGRLTKELATALGGAVVAEVPEGLVSLPVVVRYALEDRSDLGPIREAPLTLDDGRTVTIGQLAEVALATGPHQILHEDGRRRVAILANHAGRDLGSIVADVEALLARTTVAEGVQWRLGGQHESQEAATRRLVALSALCLLAMYTVLYQHLGEHRLVIQVLLGIPLALVGGIAAVWLGGGVLSVATLVGFITLAGIATRNTILMIDHLAMMQHDGPLDEALLIRGAQERLVPVLMTALCAGIALLPLAFAGGEPGKEILTPLAQVVLGGLISSTALDVVVTPVVFGWWRR